MAHLRYGSCQVIVALAISVRDNVVILLGAQRFGKVKTVTYEEAKEAAKALGNAERGWNAWVNSVKIAMPDMRQENGKGL